ncbi:reverse transcriptase domain-containing protein [Tanacetum coccineum]
MIKGHSSGRNLVLNKVPPKEKDPRGFTIPCVIEQSGITRALADLGASISLMPYSMFLRLNLGDLKPTRICIELANKTTHFPKGIAENVMVKIDKFVFPVDFVILDMEEDHRIPIILGRLFLATTHAMIDVFNKKISFELGDEIITFDLEKSIRFPPSDEDTCHSANIIDLSVVDSIKEILPQNHDNSIEPIFDHLPEDRNNPDIFTANSIDEEIPTPKLKELPSHLEYAFLDNNRHKISKVGIEVDKAKVDVIASLPYPTNMKDARFDFSDECIKSFDILRDKLITTPVIIALNWDLDFELMCEANDYAVGAVLGQQIKKKFCLIYYASKTMNNDQEHYTTSEKELLVVGTENLATDHLSRLENPSLEELNEDTIQENFPDEHLMVIKLKNTETDPWSLTSGGLTSWDPFPPCEKKYILVAVVYISKWVEAEALPTNDARVVTDAYERSQAYKERTKRWNDSKIMDKEFQKGEEATKWFKRLAAYAKCNRDSYESELGDKELA